MNSLPVLLASLALVLPVSTGGNGDAPGRQAELVAEEGASGAAPLGFDVTAEDPWQSLLDAHRPGQQEQVRIEQRVIMRITPRPPAGGRQDLWAPFPTPAPADRMVERKMGTCLPMQGIASVGTGQDNRLILFMRDRRIVSAALEKACSARQFYSGFLVERSDDGLLCVKRDKLQSRTGAKCELSQLRQLVAVKD